jgi:N-acetyl sugar amidotransferase
MSGTGRTCTFCVMDDSNPMLRFDAEGRCDCCRSAVARRPHEWWPGAEGAERMHTMVEALRAQGRGRPYDAMVGLSGGIDSAWLAHLMRAEHGLRLLAVHVDGGWNSEAAVSNIESIVRRLDIDLHTQVIEWQEMRDLQLAFLRASVLNQDFPQDHAFFATLYRTARRFDIRSFLLGVNFASESIVPPGWGHPSMDGRHLRAIHARFGQRPLESFPVMPLSEYLWMTRVRQQLTIHRPLNFIDYDKEHARAELTRLYGWRDYGGKHCESRFTKFYQEIYLPRKFGFDKRRLHLSSLIVSGQLSRADALAELATPIAPASQMRHDLKFVAKKLGVTPAELEALIDRPPVSHRSYPHQMGLHDSLTALKNLSRRLRGPQSS